MLETRTDLKARIHFTVEKDIWEVTNLNLEQNHELASEKEKCNLRSKRRISNACEDVIKFVINVWFKSYHIWQKKLGPQ